MIDRLGMESGEAAIVASHFVQLALFFVISVISGRWLWARCGVFLQSEVGLIVLSAFVAAGNRIIVASVYSSARIAHHTSEFDAWHDLAPLLAATKVLPMVAGLLFVAGCWRLLGTSAYPGGMTCEQVRKPFLRLTGALAVLWAASFWFLS